MKDIWLTLILGFVLGLGTAAVFSIYRSQRKPEAQEPTPTITDSAAEILEVLAPAGIVLNGSNVITRVTGSALATGLVDGRRLVHEKLIDLANQARSTTGVVSLEDELPTQFKGGKLFVSARAKLISDGSVLMLVDDRTESHRLDEMRKDFMANISHELKTPIGAVGLLAEAMESNLENPEVLGKLVRNIRKEAKRLSALVKDIIQLSKIQSSSTLTSTDLVNLVDVVRDAIDRNSWRSEKSEVDVEFHSDSSKVEVYGDAEMLTVAVKNLVENAIIYSHKGSTVGVAIEVVDGVANIIVKDTGVGIAKSEQRRVFERFYRVDQSRSRETGGSGLGLSIVKHAAISHMGEVKLFSKLGVGSTFTLRLPTIAKKVNRQSRRKVDLG
ncbi:MAG: hypothetical protein RLZZ06_993 [Actinomycetota bacterium]|jgi:two-component system sensor histidine kinase SenX3